jgi:hypothetical protein
MTTINDYIESALVGVKEGNWSAVVCDLEAALKASRSEEWKQLDADLAAALNRSRMNEPKFDYPEGRHADGTSHRPVISHADAVDRADKRKGERGFFLLPFLFGGLVVAALKDEPKPKVVVNCGCGQATPNATRVCNACHQEVRGFAMGWLMLALTVLSLFAMACALPPPCVGNYCGWTQVGDKCAFEGVSCVCPGATVTMYNYTAALCCSGTAMPGGHAGDPTVCE